MCAAYFRDLQPFTGVCGYNNECVVTVRRGRKGEFENHFLTHTHFPKFSCGYCNKEGFSCTKSLQRHQGSKKCLEAQAGGGAVPPLNPAPTRQTRAPAKSKKTRSNVPASLALSSSPASHTPATPSPNFVPTQTFVFTPNFVSTPSSSYTPPSTHTAPSTYYAPGPDFDFPIGDLPVVSPLSQKNKNHFLTLFNNLGGGHPSGISSVRQLFRDDVPLHFDVRLLSQSPSPPPQDRLSQSIFGAYSSKKERYNSATQSRGLELAVVHGTTFGHAMRIAMQGFEICHHVSRGWYGNGIYATTSIPYAAAYGKSRSLASSSEASSSSSSSSSFFPQIPYSAMVLLIALVIPGRVRPIYNHPLRADNVVGKDCTEGYDSHYTVVDAHDISNAYPVNDHRAISESNFATGQIADELVIFDPSRIMPLYIVFLNPGFIANIQGFNERPRLD